MYAYGRDITAEEEQAAALKHAEEALRQSQKMEAVGQLTGGVAHDFNNLLQVISTALGMLARRHVHSEAAQKLIDMANESVERGAHLTKHLLAFARRQQLVARSTDVNAAIGASGELLMRSLGGEVVIERQLDSDTWPAMADPNQLDVAILNLVLNARDAMPGGGTITIGAENFGSSAPNPPADLAKGEYVRVWVRDVGIGMSEHIRLRIFEPFFTTKGVGKGTGLGLSQVHGFAHQSGGSVRVLSSPGRGTTVEIFLPRAVTPNEGEAMPVDPMGWRGTETVLVVDDDRDVRELAVACLKEFGYRVLEADSGPHGLEVLSHEGSVDLLLTDFLMPAMNGAELLRLARRMRPDLKVIFMTGYVDLEAVTEHADPGRHYLQAV